MVQRRYDVRVQVLNEHDDLEWTGLTSSTNILGSVELAGSVFRRKV